MTAAPDKRAIVGWALYDWANSAFATTVLAGFFPVFFKEYWARGMAPADSTFWLGMVSALASVVMVLGAPFLGALADQTGRIKAYLGFFAALGIVGTAVLSVVPEGAWVVALGVFLVAMAGFSGGNIYYDALLPRVASKGRLEQISSLGFALGYLGGGLLFALNVAAVNWPAAFGFGNAVEAVAASFLSVALWWGVFSLPLFYWVPGVPRVAGEPVHPARRLAGAARQVAATVRHIRQYPTVATFLVAYWFYIDGVDTVVRMAADYGLSIGLEASHLMTALLITQFVGFPAAVAFGFLARHTGAKRGILFGLFVYLFIILWASQMQTAAEFYVLAVAVGLVQGGVQALSRALYARLVPEERSGEFFGFYNMMGKFAAVLGPLLVGMVAVVTRDNRLSILSVALLFLIGGAILYFLKLAPEESGEV